MSRSPDASTRAAKPGGTIALRALGAALRHFGEPRTTEDAEASIASQPTGSAVSRSWIGRVAGRADMRPRRSDGAVRAQHGAATALGVGWDGSVPLPDTRRPRGPAHKPVDEVGSDMRAREHLAQRIVAGHVPGRALQVVGCGVGSDEGASAKLVALARTLAGKGRSIIVDLNASAHRLAALCATDGGRVIVRGLDGLSELLAGEANFAGVIHRDHATRLHFIPAGRKEADFRDFDLIMDALTQTYDFIVLLTPIFPQSEIAKVMAPYADCVVLATAADTDAALLHLLRNEVSGAGARDILVYGRGEMGGPAEPEGLTAHP